MGDDRAMVMGRRADVCRGWMAVMERGGRAGSCCRMMPLMMRGAGRLGTGRLGACRGLGLGGVMMVMVARFGRLRRGCCRAVGQERDQQRCAEHPAGASARG
ncbi:MAG: hypothetical protein ABF665_06085, partial [Gluconacetobacter sp.]